MTLGDVNGYICHGGKRFGRKCSGSNADNIFACFLGFPLTWDDAVRHIDYDEAIARPRACSAVPDAHETLWECCITFNTLLTADRASVRSGRHVAIASSGVEVDMKDGMVVS